MGRGCFYCGETGHRKKECPHRATEVVQRQERATQSQQQLVTVDQPIRPTQSGTSANKGRPRFQEERTRGKIYHMTQEDVGAMPDVVASTLQLGLIQVYALIDHRASRSFVAHRIISNLNVLPSRLNVGMVVSTPLGKNINIDEIYKGVILYIEGVKLRVDLMPLELYDFDLILGMGWLSRYRAQ